MSDAQQPRDPIGTVRHEVHTTKDGGYSVWVKVGVGTFDPTMDDVRVAGCWLCVYSTSPGNPGCSLPSTVIEVDAHPVVSIIPGTPAAQEATK